MNMGFKRTTRNPSGSATEQHHDTVVSYFKVSLRKHAHATYTLFTAVKMTIFS